MGAERPAYRCHHPYGNCPCATGFGRPRIGHAGEDIALSLSRLPEERRKHPSEKADRCDDHAI